MTDVALPPGFDEPEVLVGGKRRTSNAVPVPEAAPLDVPLVADTDHVHGPLVQEVRYTDQIDPDAACLWAGLRMRCASCGAQDQFLSAEVDPDGSLVRDRLSPQS